MRRESYGPKRNEGCSVWSEEGVPSRHAVDERDSARQVIENLDDAAGDRLLVLFASENVA